MAEQPLGSISEHFSQLEDPRIERSKLHPLLNIIVITYLCGDLWGRELGGCETIWQPEELDFRNVKIAQKALRP